MRVIDSLITCNATTLRYRGQVLITLLEILEGAKLV